MNDNRKQHLEIIAAQLTTAYYSQHTAVSRDYRELLDTFTYILDAWWKKTPRPPVIRRSRRATRWQIPQPLIPEIKCPKCLWSFYESSGEQTENCDHRWFRRRRAAKLLGNKSLDITLINRKNPPNLSYM